MTRRIVIATCLLGFASASVGVALAETASVTTGHEVCVVLAKDANHDQTQDYCINWS